jgi:hypothetical protein
MFSFLIESFPKDEQKPSGKWGILHGAVSKINLIAIYKHTDAFRSSVRPSVCNFCEICFIPFFMLLLEVAL